MLAPPLRLRRGGSLADRLPATNRGHPGGHDLECRVSASTTNRHDRMLSPGARAAEASARRS
jgi:hypothetical protein